MSRTTRTSPNTTACVFSADSRSASACQGYLPPTQLGRVSKACLAAGISWPPPVAKVRPASATGVSAAQPMNCPGSRRSFRQPVTSPYLELVDEPFLIRHRLQERCLVELAPEPAQRSGRAVLYDAEEPHVLGRCLRPVEDRDGGLERQPRERLVEDEEGTARIALEASGTRAALGAAAPEPAIDQRDSDPHCLRNTSLADCDHGC